MMSSSNGSTIPKQVTSSIPDAGICTKWSSAKPAYKPINFKMPSQQELPKLKTEEVPQSVRETPKSKQKSTLSSKVDIGDIEARKVPHQLRSTPVVTTLSHSAKFSLSRASNPFETPMAENRKYADCSNVSGNKPSVWRRKDDGDKNNTEKQPRSDGLEVAESDRPIPYPTQNVTLPSSNDGTGGSVIFRSDSWKSDRIRPGMVAPQPAFSVCDGAQSTRVPLHIHDVPAALINSRNANPKYGHKFQSQLPSKPVTDVLANGYQRSPSSMFLQSAMDNNRKYVNSLTLPRNKPVFSIRKDFNNTQESCIRSRTEMELSDSDTIVPSAHQTFLDPEAGSQNREIACGLARLRKAPEPPKAMFAYGQQWQTQSYRAVQPVIFDPEPEPITELDSLGSSLFPSRHNVDRYHLD